jgi:cytoskeletal protein RodZ
MVGYRISEKVSPPMGVENIPTRTSQKRKRTFTNLVAVIAPFIVISLSIITPNNVVEQVKATAIGLESTETIDTSNYDANMPASTLPSMTPADFSTQGALSFTAARQSNNIVNTNTYYDIIFVTSTTAAIKEIRVTFPAGTDVSTARLVEVEGIGNSLHDKLMIGPSTISGQTVTYNIQSADVTTIPAGTQIRLELSNIVNPSSPGNGYTVTVETRGTSNNVIDGPTQSFTYPIKQIGSSDIAGNSITSDKISPTFMTSRLLLDDARGASFGWSPDGSETIFYIVDEAAILGSNPVLHNVGDNGANTQCESTGALTGFFVIQCDTPPPQGSELRYTIANLPLK